MNKIELINPFNRKPLSSVNGVWVDEDGNTFPLVNGAFRFVRGDNYTSSFGFQWNKFEKTQIDRMAKSSMQSRDRFFTATGWAHENLSGLNILEVGSGAGRFSQVVLENTAANLYSVDYSNAVEANFRNNGSHARLRLFQASIYELPFEKNQFDKVFCFGVLQHTPDFHRSVQCLCEMLRPRGELIVDFYPIRGWYTKVHAKYLLRPFTRNMDHRALLQKIENNADRLIGTYKFFHKLGLGRVINRFLPVCDIDRTIPHHLDRDTLREWVILDTFDMFSPAYDNPQRLKTVTKWFNECGLKNVRGEVIRYGEGNEITVVKGTG